jgi:tRNA(Ile)-lysidine synthase
MTESHPFQDIASVDTLFKDVLGPYQRVVLAVSGGVDSVALMTLVSRWVKAGLAPKGLTIEVATVDHGLRQGSAREAEWVAEQASAAGFAHATLAWSAEKPLAGVQERAREARYALLVAHARAARAGAVVTAHTADDQAETFLMRLGRGSGLDGLASMAAARALLPDGSVQLVRPLLGVAKAALAAMIKETGGTWLEDPSNERAEFERVRLRQAHGHLTALGLSNEKLALSAHRLSRARVALDAMTEERIATLVAINGGVFASLSREAWRREPQEVRIRMLVRLLSAFGGDSKPARLSQVEALEAAMARDDLPMAQTLGGCIVSQGRTTLRLYREPPPQPVPDMSLAAGQEVLWDWRFRVRYEPEKGGDGVDPANSPVVVRPLGLAAYATLGDTFRLNHRPPARAAAGLPSIWSANRLIAVPPLADKLESDARFSAEFIGLKRKVR